MKTIASEEINKELGEGSFWLPKKVGGLSYLYGIEVFDQVKIAKPSDLYNPLIITVLPEGLQLSIIHKLKILRVGLPFRDIKRIELKLPEEITAVREASILGRAVLWGLLLGPVAGLVAEMSGAKHGLVTEKVIIYSDGLLTLVVEQNGIESFFVASVQKGLDMEKVQRFLKKNLPQFYQE